ncbi:MAG: sucrase ferredoxin [Saccharospirillum sp.]
MTHFCALYSRDSNEPLAGTGGHPARNLLISWPSGRWSKTFWQARDMTEAELTVLAQLVDQGRRVNLIDRKGEVPEGEHRLYLMPEGQVLQVPRARLAETLEALLSGTVADLPFAPAERPLVLCCTHGKKDRCCAKFGNAAYRALQVENRQQENPLDLWQATHLGGCRLAASVLVLPARHKYGRLAPEQVADFVLRVKAQRIYVPAFRGSPGLLPAQQCAEVAALAWLEAQGEAAAVEPRAIAQSDSEQHIAVDWVNPRTRATGCLEVQCRPVMKVRYGTCADLDTGPVAARTWEAIVVRHADQLITTLGTHNDACVLST